eukprot:512026-Pelagomonas_calceolata.AAC.1
MTSSLPSSRTAVLEGKPCPSFVFPRFPLLASQACVSSLRFFGLPSHVRNTPHEPNRTERHDVAGRMIIKAFSESPWGAGLVNMDIGSGD